MIDRETPLAEIVGQMSSRSTDVLTQAAICISPKKMASCDFCLFVIFFYLFTRFSWLTNVLLNDIISLYLALTKNRGYTVAHKKTTNKEQKLRRNERPSLVTKFWNALPVWQIIRVMWRIFENRKFISNLNAFGQVSSRWRIFSDEFLERMQYTCGPILQCMNKMWNYFWTFTRKSKQSVR